MPYLSLNFGAERLLSIQNKITSKIFSVSDASKSETKDSFESFCSNTGTTIGASTLPTHIRRTPQRDSKALSCFRYESIFKFFLKSHHPLLIEKEAQRIDYRYPYISDLPVTYIRAFSQFPGQEPVTGIGDLFTGNLHRLFVLKGKWTVSLLNSCSLQVCPQSYLLITSPHQPLQRKFGLIPPARCIELRGRFAGRKFELCRAGAIRI